MNDRGCHGSFELEVSATSLGTGKKTVFSNQKQNERVAQGEDVLYEWWVLVGNSWSENENARLKRRAGDRFKGVR